MTDTATAERDKTEAPAAGTALDRHDAAEMTAPAIAMSDAELNRCFRIARALAASGMFKDARQGEQAFAKILIGRDLGLSPTEAMTNIHLIEGKPELSANLHAAKVKQTPGYDYKVVTLDNDEVVIRFYGSIPPGGKAEDGEHLGTSSFSQEDAKQAKLDSKTTNAGDSNYAKFPRNMLFARAMTNGVAWFCPEVMGSIRVYAVGEVSDMQDGEPIAEVNNDYDWELIEDAEVRERARGAIETARELEPGAWPAAKIEMTLSGRPPQHIASIVAQIEASNGEALRKRTEVAEAEPVDAEVVEGEEAPAAPQEGAEAPADPEASPDDTLKADALRARCLDLEAHVENAEGEQAAALREELEQVRAELADLGGEVPGQSSLDTPDTT